MGIWAENGSLSDEDMVAGFANWVVENKCRAVVSASDEKTLKTLSYCDPRYIWVETVRGYNQLMNVASFQVLNSDGTLNLVERDGEVALAFYLCDVPSTDDSIFVVGGAFYCEECEGLEDDGDPDCSLCEGDGGFRGTIHDREIQGELLGELAELDATIPVGFVVAPQGSFYTDLQCVAKIPADLPLHIAPGKLPGIS